MTRGERDEAVPEMSGRRSRALGSVLGAATGDALGAPYEFQAPIPASDDVTMTGGGILQWGAGEWTDDTSMSIVILETAAAAADDHDLRRTSSLDQIAREWYAWSIGAPDIGAMTSQVISHAVEAAGADARTFPSGADFAHAAEQYARSTSRSEGNGCLMRTHAVVPAYLTAEDDALAQAVEAICHLTHRGADAEEACMLWSFAVRHAMLTGDLDIRIAIDRLDPLRAEVWRQRIAEAESASPLAFPRNGWVVHAFQAAWSAIHSTLPLPQDKFGRRAAMTAALESAVRAGYDTDTVASIAGGLLGAALGHKAIQPEWRRALFGWPGYDAAQLMTLVDRIIGEVSEPTASR